MVRLSRGRGRRLLPFASYPRGRRQTWRGCHEAEGCYPARQAFQNDFVRDFDLVGARRHSLKGPLRDMLRDKSE